MSLPSLKMICESVNRACLPCRPPARAMAIPGGLEGRGVKMHTKFVFGPYSLYPVHYLPVWIFDLMRVNFFFGNPFTKGHGLVLGGPGLLAAETEVVLVEAGLVTMEEVLVAVETGWMAAATGLVAAFLVLGLEGALLTRWPPPLLLANAAVKQEQSSHICTHIASDIWNGEKTQISML